MDIESYRSYCLSRKGVTEEFPFGESVLVYKVMGKMFALAGIEHFESVNLKVDPEKGVELRERYTAVQPGYHMNKKTLDYGPDRWVNSRSPFKAMDRQFVRFSDLSTH